MSHFIYKCHEGFERIVLFFSLAAASSCFPFVIYEFTLNMNTILHIFHFKKKMLNMP
jgi:hypothetical protein